jgi:hypothetical protein
MTPVEFKPTNPASERLQIHAYDCAATGIGQIIQTEVLKYFV